MNKRIHIAFFALFGVMMFFPTVSVIGQGKVKTKKMVEYHEDSVHVKYVYYVIDQPPYDIKHGTYIWYYDNGRKKAVTNYKNGMPDGKFVTYHRNGLTKASGHFENGSLTGTVKNYYGSGRLENVGEYVAGRKHGPWKFYTRGGSLLRIENYAHGELIETP